VRAHDVRWEWEVQHPEEAAKKRTEEEALVRKIRTLAGLAGDDLKAPERRGRHAELKARADCCAQCARPFEASETIYRRAERGSFGPVLPYCAAHRCPQPDGLHNSDARGGFYYPSCRCSGEGVSAWCRPEPCAGCGRMVANDRKTASPHKFVRQWQTQYELDEGQRILARCKTPEERDEVAQEVRSGPVVRIFCSEQCRRATFRAQARAKRESTPRKCECCPVTFIPARADARYCSSTCRQRAYRERAALLHALPAGGNGWRGA
jgi:hypothetical protein